MKLSYTALVKLLTCGRDYQYNYIFRRPRTPRGKPLLLGQLSETAIDYHNELRIQGGSGLDITEVKDYIKSRTNEVYDQEPTDVPAEKLPDLEEQAISLAEMYIAELAPLYQPTTTQWDFRFPIPDSDIWVVGRADGLAEGHLIIENKTSLPGWWTDRRAAHSLQPTVYAFAYYYMYGVPPLTRYHVVEKSGKGARGTLVVDAPRSMRDMEWLLGTMRDAARMIRAGVYVPTTPDNPHCTSTGCSNYKECKLGITND